MRSEVKTEDHHAVFMEVSSVIRNRRWDLGAWVEYGPMALFLKEAEQSYRLHKPSAMFKHNADHEVSRDFCI